MVGTVECLAGCLGLVAVFDALLESSPSSTGAGAPRRAGVFCSVSPAAGKGADGSSFTYVIQSPGALGPAPPADFGGLENRERLGGDGAS